MKIKNNKSIVTGIPAWALSLLTAFLSLIILFVLAGIIVEVFQTGDAGEIIAYLVYDILIAIACFFICRKEPAALWYVPVISNTMGIISAIVEPNFWITYLWILICGGWAISLAGAIAGAITGRSRLKMRPGL